MIDLLYVLQGQKTLTGTTVETPLAYFTVPAAVVGTNGTLRINTAYSHNLSTGNKVFRWYYGGVLLYTDTENTASATQSYTARIHFRGFNSQVVVFPSAEWTTAGGNPESTVAVNGAIAQPFVVTGQLANAADNLSLDALEIETLRIG